MCDDEIRSSKYEYVFASVRDCECGCGVVALWAGVSGIAMAVTRPLSRHRHLPSASIMRRRGRRTGELASLNELPREAHCRFFTACSKFNVDRLRLGLIVCNSIKASAHSLAIGLESCDTYTETGTAQLAQVDAAK